MGESSSTGNRSHLLVFSANHLDSLKRIIENYQRHVATHSHLLKDMAYTLGARREHLPYRAFCVTNGQTPLEPSLFTKCKSRPQIAFVFTGQGAQWAGMAKELFEDFAGFRDDIRAMDNGLAELPIPPSWTIEGNVHFRTSKLEFFLNK